MAIETANRASESLLPIGLLDGATREAVLSASMPSFVVDREAGRVLWSSHAAARRIGALNGAALMRAGLPPLAGGTQRLQALAKGIDSHASKRLERLRFNTGFRSVALTAICEPIPFVAGGFGLLVSFIEAKPIAEANAIAEARPVRDDLFEPENGSEIIAPQPVTRIAAEDAAALGSVPPLRRRQDDLAVPDAGSAALAEEAGSEPSAPESLTPESLTPESSTPESSTLPGWISQPAGERRPMRFVFALDANGIVERVTPPLADAVGFASADIVGRALAGIVDAFDEPAAETIRTAVLAGQTWSGLSVHWPVSGTGLAVPIDLSALPLVNSDIGLTGFSGFGRCHIDRAIGAVPDPVAAPTAAIPEVTSRGPLPDAEAGTRPENDNTHQVPAPVEPGGMADPDLAPALEAFGALDHTEAPDTAGSSDDLPIAAEAETPPSGVVEKPGLNVFLLKTGQPATSAPAMGKSGLSMAERNAFREIARALGAKFDPDLADEAAAAAQALSPSTSQPSSGDAGAASGAPILEPPAASEPLASAPPPAAVRPEVSLPAGAEILDQLPIGLLVLRGDEPLFANRTLLDLTGYPDLQTFIATDGARAIFRKGQVPRDRNAEVETVVLTSREGEMMPVDAHLQTTRWDGGMASLISLRRATELEQGKALHSVALDLKRIRAEAQELRAILDTATDGVVTLDEKGQILSLNGSAEALFGLNQNEVAGGSFTSLLLNESHAEALDYFDGVRANGVRSVLNDGRDVFGREKKGGRIPLFMTLGRISEDEPRRYCAVLRDLTSWKRAEAELTEARRAAEFASAKKSDFLTKISHEIRTPMNAIIGFAEVMMEERLGPVGNPKYKEYLGDIRTSGRHVVSLVNDLLDLAKIEAGRMELDFAATDLNAIVASAVGIIQPQANANRVLVRTQLAAKLPPVVADERSIRQIILNMLSNATRFTESGGQVIVATALLDSGEAVIRIRDTGVGMTATEIEQALEPFRQVGTRRDHGGTGLGLPLTKALVEANRANFAIRSTPGEGTMVEITFPSTRVLAE